MKVRARVYTKDGNRFIVPGHWYSNDDPDIGLGSMSAVLCESMIWGVVCDLDAKEWIDLEAGEDGQGTIEHYLLDMVSPKFAHGGVKVLLIGGPMFDEEHAEAVRFWRGSGRG